MKGTVGGIHCTDVVRPGVYALIVFGEQRFDIVRVWHVDGPESLVNVRLTEELGRVSMRDTVVMHLLQLVEPVLRLQIELVDEQARSLQILLRKQVQPHLCLPELEYLQIGLLGQLLHLDAKVHVLVDEQREDVIDVHEHGDLIELYLVANGLAEAQNDLVQDVPLLGRVRARLIQIVHDLLLRGVLEHARLLYKVHTVVHLLQLGEDLFVRRWLAALIFVTV